MANPTTNYGWPMPTSTDLVTDLPADFAAFGQPVDTTLKALNPETTLGDISYRSATSNTNTRLGIGTNGQVLAVSGGVPAWTTTSDVTPLTTKGDLFTFDTADARLAVGTNGQVLTADSTAATGLAWATASSGSTNMAGKNGVLNSNMSVWQRGTSFSLAASTAFANGITADRWQTTTGTNQACTISRQATGDTTNLPFIQYALRYQRNSGQTGTAGLYLAQSFETVNSIPFAGKTVTLSFYARAGANYSATSNALAVFLTTGTGTDQNTFNTFTGATQAISQTATLTTTWQRFSYSATFGSTITQIAPTFGFTPTGTASTNDYYEITGVQLEIAASATAYSPNAATFQGELAACQRYYYRIAPNASYRVYASSQAVSANEGFMTIPFPVQMRIRPTALDQSGTAGHYSLMNASGVRGACTSVPIYDTSTTQWQGLVSATATGHLVAGNCTTLGAENASSYLGWSAEL